MAVIDIGTDPFDGSLSISAGTRVDLNNPANDTGVLDTFECWFSATSGNAADVKMGTFSGSGTDYDDRDYETIGTVTCGSKQTFTGKNCDVSSGDFIGYYCSAGRIEGIDSGDGIYVATGDKFGSGSNTYTYASARTMAIYATGSTAAAGNPYYYYLQQ